MIARFFFERPGVLFAFLIASELALVGLWRWRGGRKPAQAVWIGLGAIPILLGASVWVVTPRERITRLCHELAHHVERGSAAAVEHHLHEHFEAAGYDRERLAERLEAALKRYRIDDVRLRHIEVSFRQPNTGVAQLDALCMVQSADVLYERIFSRWRVEFRRNGNKWRVMRIEALPTPLSPVRNLRDWLR